MKKSKVTSMSLDELRNLIESTSGKQLPSARTLRESCCEIVAIASVGKDAQLTVYKNGFFIYCVEGRSIVGAVDRCGDYRDDDDPSYQLDAAVFEYESWSLRLAMEGEKKLRYNSDKRNGNTYSYSAVVTGEVTDAESSDLRDPFDFAAHLADQDCVAKMLACLTERQRQVVQMYYLQNMTQQIIADRLGIAKRVVGHTVEDAVRKIQKNFRKF